MNCYSRVRANVNLDAVRHNMIEFRRNIGTKSKLCAVVKTDGYGLGAVPVAKTVEDLVWGYAVATADEAITLRINGISKPVLVLGYVPEEQFEQLVDYSIRYAGFRKDQIEKLSKIAIAKGKKAFVHIKVDTGMSRIGVMPGEAFDLVKLAFSMEGLVVEGLFTHMATADMIQNAPAKKQQQEFSQLVLRLEDAGIRPEICHCANSAAGIWMTDCPGDMFRIGISLYGYYPSDEVDKTRVSLRPALELKSVISCLKMVPEGTAVGYGGTFVAKRPTRIATVPIGYGDGYPRSLSNRGYMLVGGRRAMIAGRVCMDQVMLDVTDIDGLSEGDEVTLVGCNGNERITIEELSALAGSFNYEFLCDIGKRIPRVYYRDGKVVGCKDYFRDEYRDFM